MSVLSGIDGTRATSRLTARGHAVLRVQRRASAHACDAPAASARTAVIVCHADRQRDKEVA